MTFKESIERLKSSGYTADAKELEQAWGDIEVDEMFANMKQVKDIIQFIDTFVFSVNQKLANQRGLELSDREYEMGRKDAMLAIKNLFSPNDIIERRQYLQIQAAEKVDERSDN